MLQQCAKSTLMTIPAKKEEKWVKYNWIFRSKSWLVWPLDSFEIGLPNLLHTALFFVKCKCPNSYSVNKPHYLELIHSNKFWPKSLKNGALVHISMHIHLSFLCPFFLEGQHFWMLCLLILRGLFSSWPLFSWCIDTGCLKSKVYDING